MPIKAPVLNAMPKNAFTPLEMKSLTGFTIQELTLIIFILVILVAVAVPAYQAIDRQAKAASVRGTLDEVRAAIKVYQMNEKLEGRAEVWPAWSAVVDADDGTTSCEPSSCPSNHIFSDCHMPDNPFSNTNKACANNYVSLCEACPGRPVSPPPDDYGWAYDSKFGDFWANSNVMGENTW